VVVSVENAKKQLLPGMTARVNFVTRSAEDVLKVANAALRFKPENGVTLSRGEGEGPSRSRKLHFVDEKGELKSISVRAGVTDGSFTEVRGEGVKEGMKVIAGTAQPQSAQQANNPFQSTTSQQQRGPRGGF
jgi:HlyD family secretion protein